MFRRSIIPKSPEDIAKYIDVLADLGSNDALDDQYVHGMTPSSRVGGISRPTLFAGIGNYSLSIPATYRVTKELRGGASIIPAFWSID